MADVEGKKLTELRVIDLKTELERRGLDKTGNKAALLERLSKVYYEKSGLVTRKSRLLTSICCLLGLSHIFSPQSMHPFILPLAHRHVNLY